MNLRQYDDSTGEFHVVIDSTRKNPHHTQNTGTNFCYSVVPPIQLEDDYLVSINSITFPTYFKTIPVRKKESYIKVTRMVLTADNTFTTLAEITVPFNPKNKNFYNIQDVVNGLNEMAMVDVSHEKAQYFRNGNLEGRFIKFVVSVVKGIKKITCIGIGNTIFDFPREVATILGVTESNQSSFVGQRWILDVKSSTTMGIGGEAFTSPPDIVGLIPQTLFIYTDFTQPINIGDTQANLLQIIPIKSDALDMEKDQYITETFQRPHWVQIRTRTLSDLRFKILKSDGERIEFQNSNDGVILVLTFKKMNAY